MLFALGEKTDRSDDWKKKQAAARKKGAMDRHWDRLHA